MHELSIMQGALEAALERAREAGATRIHEVRLRIGVLSGVVPDALQFAFEALTAGGMAEGARLTIEDVSAQFWCAGCQCEFQADDVLLVECPVCHQPGGEVRAGRELELVSVEIE